MSRSGASDTAFGHSASAKRVITEKALSGKAFTWASLSTSANLSPRCSSCLGCKQVKWRTNDGREPERHKHPEGDHDGREPGAAALPDAGRRLCTRTQPLHAIVRTSALSTIFSTLGDAEKHCYQHLGAPCPAAAA